MSDLEEVRALLRDYEASLPVRLDFQGFDREVAGLPGAYAPPLGSLLVLRTPERTAGCVALRPLVPGICELKRLFVRPEHRGAGYGRVLATAAIERARELGYARMRLDTLPGMAAARSLYLELGFRPVAAYTPNPIEGAAFLELQL